jgi:hypothetical protein
MYGLPKSFDPSVFRGKTLDQVCFTVNSITLSFEGRILLTILGTFILRERTNARAVKQAVPVMTSNLMSLTGKTVQNAQASTDGTLVLRFEGGRTLTLVDDSRMYESYALRIGDNEIVV